MARHRAIPRTAGEAAKAIVATAAETASAMIPACVLRQWRPNNPTRRMASGSAAAPTRHPSAGIVVSRVAMTD